MTRTPCVSTVVADGCLRAVTACVALGVLVAGAGAQAQTRDWPSEKAPAPLTAREATFPPYEMRTLPNGLQVVVVLHHEQPAVSIRLLVRAGAARDPQNKPGVARLLASLLDQGTTTRSAQEIAEQIDFIGGSLGTVAAAMEGTLLGVPAIALSQQLSDLDRVPWATSEHYGPDLIRRVWAMGWEIGRAHV